MWGVRGSTDTWSSFLDFVNKGGQEPIAGQRLQVGIPGPERKERKEGGFFAMLWKEQHATIMQDPGAARVCSSAVGWLPEMSDGAGTSH